VFSQRMNSTFRWQLLSTAGITLIQVTTLVLLGRMMGFKDLGNFALLQITFRFALAAFEPGMFFSIIQQHELNEPLNKKLNFIQTRIAILTVLAFVLIFLYTQEFNAWPFAIISCLLLFTIAFGSRHHNYLILIEKQKEIAFLQILSYTIELIFIFSTISIYPALYVFSVGILLRQLIYYSMCYYLCLHFPKMESVVSFKNISINHIRPSIHNMASQILSFIQGQYDTLLILLLFGLQTLGPYNLASEFSFLLFSKINPIFSKAIFPSLSKANKQLSQLDKIILSSFTSYLYIIIPIYFFIWLHAEFILNLAYPNKASEINIFVHYFLIIALIKAINNILTTYLLSIGFSKWILHWNVLLVVSNYLICTLFLYFSIDIIIFLKFNIIYAFIFTVLGIIFLFKNISVSKIRLLNTSLQLTKFLSLLIITIYANSLLFENFYLNSLLALVYFFIILYLINHQKFVQLLQFKIS